MTPEANDLFTPAVHRDPGPTAESVVRYGWAATLVEGRTVLDASCGSGWGVARLASRAKTAVGVDLSPPIVEEARRLHGTEVEFRCEDPCRLPFADGEFDVVVWFEAIERVGDSGGALDELRRVLHPGGVLLLSAANRDVYPAGNPLHVREFSATELSEQLERHFANVTLHPQQTYFASLLGGEELPVQQGDSPVQVEIARPIEGGVAEALYLFAVAGDGELPSPPTRAALGRDVDYEEQRTLVEAWQERALEAEMEVEAIRTELEFALRDRRDDR